jgi:tripartite-type tricarboxylate transporter receptor subunit TctC
VQYFWRDTMNFARRDFLHFAVGAAALPAFPHVAAAQAYPARPVRIIHGFAPNGGSDIIARLIGGRLSDRLGQPFVVESRPGDATNIATEAVVRAAADGYTLLLATSPSATNATLYPNLKFNFIRDIAPVAFIGRLANVMEVNPSFPANTVPEFIAFAKANPDKVRFASAGNGTAGHISGELFNMMAGVSMAHVPYRSTALAVADLLSGQVQVMFENVVASMEYIRAGKLRPLAVTTTTRSALLPDISTVADVLPGFDSSPWFGVGAPKGAPAEIIGKLNREINTALADPKVAAGLADLGTVLSPGSSADFARLIAAETDKWGKVVKFSGTKVE